MILMVIPFFQIFKLISPESWPRHEMKSSSAPPSALTLSGVRTSIRSRPGHGASGFYHANMVKVRRLWCKIHHFLRGFRSNSAGCGDCSSHIFNFSVRLFSGSWLRNKRFQSCSTPSSLGIRQLVHFSSVLLITSPKQMPTSRKLGIIW